MVAHQTKGLHLDPISLARGDEQIHEAPAVIIVKEDVPPVRASGRDMEVRVWPLQPRRSCRHKRTLDLGCDNLGWRIVMFPWGRNNSRLVVLRAASLPAALRRLRCDDAEDHY